MNIEGLPYLGPDKTYDEQRKCRLQDAIDDYLQDDTVDSRRIYEDILSCIEDVLTYHQKHVQRASQLKTFMKGRKDLDFVDDMLDDPQLAHKWQYDRILLNEDNHTLGT